MPSLNQQEEASNAISNIVMPLSSKSSTVDNNTKEDDNLNEVNNNSAAVAHVYDIVPVTQGNITRMSTTCSKVQSDYTEKKENPMSLFHNAVISGGTININIVSGSTKKNSSGKYITQSQEVTSSQE